MGYWRAAGVVDQCRGRIADGRVDASSIKVDTSASTKTVVLKGSVPIAEQKATGLAGLLGCYCPS